MMIQRFKGGYEIVTDDAADCVGSDPLADEVTPLLFQAPQDMGLFSREAESRVLRVLAAPPEA